VRRRAALYNRVSTPKQTAPHGALSALRDYARSINATIAIQRAEVTTGSRNGPDLDQLLAALRAGQADLLIVPRVDRIGRNALHIHTNVQTVLDAGAELHIVEQRIVVKPERDMF